jgi:hypothetical protein
MKVKKVFLKFNRPTISALNCLNFWIDIFKDYDVTIITDLFNAVDEPKIELLKAIDQTFINTDYLSSDFCKHLLGENKWCAVAAVNFTCFNLTNEPFWLIDADDTIFLDSNYDKIREKIKKVEKIFFEKNYQGLSLDFYRESWNSHWSFGVALLHNSFDFSMITSIDKGQVSKYGAETLDVLFDILRKNGSYKLESFVFDDTFFHHHLFYKTKREGITPFGVYYWKDRKLWNFVDIDETVLNI